MGLEVTTRLEEEECQGIMHVSVEEIHRLVNSVRRLSGKDLKLYFELLFGRMTPTSKEAMSNIMWNSLNTREQANFELPNRSIQRGEADIIARLENGFVSPNAVMLTSSPRADGESPGSSRNPRSFQDALFGRRTASTGTAAAGQTGGRSPREFEDQIFTVLMEAILRAERGNRDPFGGSRPNYGRDDDIED